MSSAQIALGIIFFFLKEDFKEKFFIFLILSANSCGKYQKEATKVERCLKLRIENGFRDELEFPLFWWKTIFNTQFLNNLSPLETPLPDNVYRKANTHKPTWRNNAEWGF